MAGTTDFVAAQKANRRNTLLLLVVLTAARRAGFGYLVGWVLESEATDEVAAGEPGRPGAGERLAASASSGA